MTEKEAIEKLKSENKRCLSDCEGACWEIENNQCNCFDAVIEKMIDELFQYRVMEEKLKSVYGECEGILSVVVDTLIKHVRADIDRPIKSRMLTDEHVDMWEAYKAIGTVEECRAAVDIVRTGGVAPDKAAE